MGKTRKSYDVSFKKKVVETYFNEGKSVSTLSEEFNVHNTVIARWVKKFEAHGVKGLEDNRGKAKGLGKGRPRIDPEDPEVRIKRLEAENEMLKKLLKM